MPGRPQKAGCFQLFTKYIFGAYGDGRVTGLQAGVAAQPYDRGFAPFRCNLVVEEAVDAKENRAADILIRQKIFLVGERQAILALARLNENFEILLDERILLGGEPGAERLERFLRVVT